MEKLIPISEVVWFQEGPGVRNSQYTTQGVKLLNVANLIDGKIDLSNTNRYISENEAYGKYNHFLVDEGDLIIASSGIKVDYFDKKMGFIKKEHLPLCMNTSTIRFKVLNKNNLDIQYFMYYLKSESFKQQLSVQITGSAQLNFGPSHLKKMTIKMAPIDQQKQIAATLDKVTDLIDKRRKQLEKLDELVKARFVEMFGEPETNRNIIQTIPMTELCEIIDGDRGKNYPKQEEFLEEGYCLFLNAKNVTNNGFDFSNCMYISREKDNALRNGKLQRGDIVLTTRGTIGNLAFFTENIPFENIRINSGMVILRIDKKRMSEIFFIEQFKMQLDSIKRRIASGSAQPQLPISTMNNIKILVPNINLQTQFADFVTQVDKQKSLTKQSLEKLETLKKSLMQEYFG